MSEGNVHPPNQMRLLAELQVNYNNAFGLGAGVARWSATGTCTSTSKLYFVTRFSVIFADFASSDSPRGVLKPQPNSTGRVYNPQARQVECLERLSNYF